MRQLLALALTFYVLILTLTPCVDALIPSGGSGYARIECPASDSQSGHHDECSPFCTCSCCQVCAEVSFAMPLPGVAALSTELRTPVMTRVESLVFHAIWEPPKA